MDRLTGRVAVVTGGAGGLGRAMGETFARRGMRVVLADVQADPLDATVAELRADGLAVDGVVTDVTSYESVEALRDRTLELHGAVHLVCNNAGIGAGAEGRLWEHDLMDWKWALGVNLMGVVHGINAFVPAMLEGGDEGHVVNTSSGNGGISPLPGSPQYAVTKAAVVTLTECLHGQLQEAGASIGASVLFPGPHMLRTGLFESWRSRPDRFAKDAPDRPPTPRSTISKPRWQQPGSPSSTPRSRRWPSRWSTPSAPARSGSIRRTNAPTQQLRARTESILARTNPAYLRALPG
jgi:NAD(P)-dependent dehydrogenase (short-subunit alcohol dehydrogenase family)